MLCVWALYGLAWSNAARERLYQQRSSSGAAEVSAYG